MTSYLPRALHHGISRSSTLCSVPSLQSSPISGNFHHPAFLPALSPDINYWRSTCHNHSRGQEVTEDDGPDSATYIAETSNMKFSLPSSSLVGALERLTIQVSAIRPSSSILSQLRQSPATTSTIRAFSSTPAVRADWLQPQKAEKKRSRKGRPRVPTGGSARGTTVVWGDYGLRMCDHHRRVSAMQLKNGEEAIKVRLRGMRYRLYKRVCANIGVYSSGNEVGLDQLG